MSEQIKTLTFTGAALVVLGLALTTRPQPAQDVSQIAHQSTLNDADPLAATKLQIVKFNEETASIDTFRVAQIDGVWSIPSRQDYPADAQQQMAAAATSVMGLTVLGVPNADASTHAAFGVVDPDINTLTVGAVGVGLRVTMQDETGAKLVDLIIGSEVQGQTGQRYVREPGRDPVYIVALDPSKLTTRFQDWIEDDLLKLNAPDIKQVYVNDYSSQISLTLRGPQISWDPRSEMTLSYDSSASAWTMDLLKEFEPNAEGSGELVETELGEDEEVASAALNDLKTALDDLKIIDVERKPDGVSRSLRAEEGFDLQGEAGLGLADRGFVLVPMPTGELEMLSSEGEVVCTLKDGVEYVLRFGQIALGAEGGVAGEADASTGINRYLFVMARYNDSIIEKPQLAELPDVPEQEAATDEAAADDSAEESSTEDADDAADDETTEDASVDEATDPETSDAAGELADSETDVVASEDVAEETDPAVAAREAIEAANQRELDAYDEKVQKAKDRVTELNDRFADWYYVISDSVYAKLHLSKADVVIKKTSTPEAGVGGVLPGGEFPGGVFPGGVLPSGVLPSGVIPSGDGHDHPATLPSGQPDDDATDEAADDAADLETDEATDESTGEPSDVETDDFANEMADEDSGIETAAETSEESSTIETDEAPDAAPQDN